MFDMGTPEQHVNLDLILARHLLVLPVEFIDRFLTVRFFKPQNVKLFLLNLCSDSPSVQLKKLRILKLGLTEANARFLLGEVSEYLQATQGPAFSREGISLVISVASLVPALAGACMKGLIRMMNYPVISDDAIIAVRQMLVREEDPGPLSHATTKAAAYLAQSMHSIRSASARVAALWLIGHRHDSIAVVVPNTLRTVAKTMESEAPIVKLQLSVLALKVLQYHERNARDTLKGTRIPSHVSAALLAPLQSLTNYILQVSAKDAIAGKLTNVLSLHEEDAGFLHSLHDSCQAAATPAIVELSESAVRQLFPDSPFAPNQRPTQDSNDSCRDSKKPLPGSRSDNHDSRSYSSHQSAVNSTFNVYCVKCGIVGMSSNVSVPATSKNFPKAVTTLEDLDMFFTKEVQQSISSSPKLPTESRTINGATLDLSNADWLQSFT